MIVLAHASFLKPFPPGACICPKRGFGALALRNGVD